MMDLDMTDTVKIDVRTESDVVTARQRGRRLAEELSFSESELTMIATAISELARNIIVYAGDGEVEFGLVRNGTRSGIKIIARDNGPGIPNLDQVMEDGFSTGGSLGVGLPGARRLMDEFDIKSEPGQGTIVIIGRWA